MTRLINDLGGLWQIVTVTVVFEVLLSEYILSVRSYLRGWSFTELVILMSVWSLVGVLVYALRDLRTTRLVAVSIAIPALGAFVVAKLHVLIEGNKPVILGYSSEDVTMVPLVVFVICIAIVLVTTAISRLGGDKNSQ